MYLDTKKLIILLILYLNSLSFVYNQRNEETDSDHTFGFVKLVQKYAEHIHILENLKLVSGEDRYFLNEIQNFLPKNFYPLLVELFAETDSIKCFRDLLYLLENVKSLKGWSLKMLDSYGKPESGILLGNFRWLGEYDECLSSYAPPKRNKASVGNFHGKYCTLQVPLKQGNMTLPLVVAACLPESCNPNGLILSNRTKFKMKGLLSNLDERIGSALSNAKLTCKIPSKKLTTADIIVISLMSFVFLLAIIGSSITAFEYYAKENTTKFTIMRTNDSDKPSINGEIESISSTDSDAFLVDTGNQVTLPVCLEKCKPFFNCFCIFTNGEKILNTSTEGQLPCLHGIRFLSMSWVIVCHSYAFGFSVVRNLTETIDYVDHWQFQVILNGFYSVDSFFLLSGFLVAYIFFQQAPKSDFKMPWLYFYIHRYIRLTPTYMVVVAFWTFIYPFLTSGPLSLDDNIGHNCKVSWWWNLLYINNFQPAVDQCMGWSWYLANDLQFYIISPLLLVTLWRCPKVGYSIFGLFFSIALISSFVITYEYNLVAGLGNIVDEAKHGADYMQRWSDFFEKYYIKPYTRIAPYLVGLLLAYYLYKRKQNNSTKLNLITLSVGWMIASSITLACLFGLYHQELTLVASSFYNAFNHLGFSLGLAWVIFVCIIGQADAVNGILSWKAWIPLSRLTYCAYLIHPIVIFTYYSSVRRLVEFNHINMVMFHFGFLIISYTAAAVTSLLFESPVIRLERLLRDKLTNFLQR